MPSDRSSIANITIRCHIHTVPVAIFSQLKVFQNYRHICWAICESNVYPQVIVKLLFSTNSYHRCVQKGLVPKHDIPLLPFMNNLPCTLTIKKLKITRTFILLVFQYTVAITLKFIVGKLLIISKTLYNRKRLGTTRLYKTHSRNKVI